MKDLVIREYKSNDYDRIVQILKDAELYDEIWGSRANFTDLASRNSDNIFVAEMNGEIVGVQRIVPQGPDLAILYRLAVKAEFRERGIATRLLEKAAEIAKKRGICELGMYVDSRNDKLLNFYSERNFRGNINHDYKYLWQDLSKSKEEK